MEEQYYGVVAALVPTEAHARPIVGDLCAMGYADVSVQRTPENLGYRVICERTENRSTAMRVAEYLQDEGYGDAYICLL